MTYRIHVGNLPYVTTEHALWQLFGTSGNVRSVQIVRHPETHYPRGYGFVEMATSADALAAVERLHLAVFNGKVLEVTRAGQNGVRPMPLPRAPRLNRPLKNRGQNTGFAKRGS
jgi:RNA recognition motif-containing protein